MTEHKILLGTIPGDGWGYKRPVRLYGTAWLVKPLTDEVIELARSIGCVVP